MSTLNHRVDDLETQAGTSATWDEADVLWMSTPSLLATGTEFAARIAQRRAIADGLRWDLLERAERRALARVELRAGAAAIRAAPDLHTGIKRWLADAEALPALRWPAIDCGAFLEYLSRDREIMDLCRGRDDPYANEWRRRNPTWRPGFLPHEADQWEASLGTAWVSAKA